MYSISDWFKKNLLVLHAGKTKMLIFNENRKEFQHFPPVYINNSEISIVNEIKYLGLNIDSKLNWNSHINFLIKKLSPYVGVLRRISYVCGDNVKKNAILFILLFKHYISINELEWHKKREY